MINTSELLVILAVVLVLFGASAIPRFARSLGQAKREFEKGLKEGREEEPGEGGAGEGGKKEGKG